MQAFEYSGYWWLPATPDTKVAGTLKFSDTDGLDLQLFNSLTGDLQQLFAMQAHYDLVVGVVTANKQVTLVDCDRINATFSSNGLPTERLMPSVALVGAHFQSVEELSFDRAEVRYSYLAEWAGVTGWTSTSKQEGSKEAPDLKLEYRFPEEPTASTQLGDLRVKFRLHSHGNLYSELSLSQTAHLAMVFRERVGHSEIMQQFVSPMQDFLTLATQKANAISELVLYSPDKLKELGSGSNYPLPIEVIFPRVMQEPPSAEPPAHGSMLFDLPAIRDDFASTVAAWLHVSTELGPIMNLVFSARYAPFSYVQHRFLNIAHAAESYHRARYSNEVLPRATHKERCQSVLESVPADVRGWVKDRLEYSNEPTFRARIAELWDSAADVMAEIARHDVLVSRVADTRNYWTHYNKRLKKAARDGASLHYLTEKLTILIEACLLAEIGIDGERRLAAFQRLQKYRLLSQAPT